MDFGQEIWAIEIKKTTVPNLPKGFHIACEDLMPTCKYVVNGGDQAFGLAKDITGTSLAALMNEISSLQKQQPPLWPGKQQTCVQPYFLNTMTKNGAGPDNYII